jgi:anthranilate phosphoribosyltransferase
VLGRDGLDELTICQESIVSELRNGTIRHYTVTPESLGIARAQATDLSCASVTESAEIIWQILGGKKGAQRDIVVLNAAFALIAAGLAETPETAIPLAVASIDSGKAKQKLEVLIRKSAGKAA